MLQAPPSHATSPPAIERPAEVVPPVLYAMGAEGELEPLAVVDFGGRPVQAIAPLLARSERRPRVGLAREGLRFVLAANGSGLDAVDEVSVRALEHSADAQVFFASQREIVLVGPPRLPASVVERRGGADRLPELARQDANCVRGEELRVEGPGADLALVGIAGEAPPILPFWDEARLVSSEPVWCGPHHANVRRLGEDGAAAIDTARFPLDQLFFATVTPVDEASLRELAIRSAEVRETRALGWRPRLGEGPAWPAIELGPALAEDGAAASDGPLGERLARRDGRTSRPLLADHGLVVAFDSPPPAREGHTWSFVVRARPTGGNLLHDVPAVATWPEPTPPSGALFRDVARASGVAMVHFEGPDLQLDIRPTMGPGAAWGDADGDGWVDLFLPQGGGREGSAKPRSRFYKNRGDGTFADESAARGLALEGAGMGALFFDADGDRDLDLFVASYGANRFLENDGKGRFTDRSAEAGLAGERWNTAASAADFDRDGDLDLYVTAYLEYDLAKLPPPEELGRYQREDPIEMLPFAFPGASKLFLVNERREVREAAAGREPLPFAFRDRAAELGLDDPLGRGMQAIFWDFDRDGDQDLALANDVSPNRAWRNEGDGTWKDVSLGTGLDDPRGCMGLSAGDVDGDGDEDLFVTNWQLEANALYQNNLVAHASARSRVAAFRDVAVQAGLAQLKVGVTAWGAELADFDLDGDLDVLYANGYTSPDYESTGICVGQPCHYFESDGRGKFLPAFEKAGPDAALPLAARAAQACDYDQDGDLDLVVTANNGRVRLLRNELERGGRRWLGVRLRGRGGNAFAIGAEVEVRAGERVWRRALRAGTSYLGGNAPELHFGLGEVAKVDALVVRWPSGRESAHAVEGLDRFVTLAEPAEAR